MADIFQIIENNGTPKSIEDRKARTNIAPYFEASNANAVGDLVLSDTGVLYRFNAAYSAGTSWSSRTSKEEVNLAEIKAPLDSPAFTGIPTAPTAAAGTSNTQIATTAYADTSSSNAVIPINSSINAINSSLAIVSNGDTHIALTTGQYIYVKNHSSLAEGLYTANSAIGANVALTSSNVTRVQENGSDIGGLNNLYKIIAKPIKYKSGSVSGEVSTTDAGNGITILSTTVNVSNSAFLIATIEGVFNITTATMQLRMSLDGSTYTLLNTNLTGTIYRFGQTIEGLSAGTHTIKLYATPQGGGYTLKIPSYNSARGRIIIIEQSSEQLQ